MGKDDGWFSILEDKIIRRRRRACREPKRIQEAALSRRTATSVVADASNMSKITDRKQRTPPPPDSENIELH